MQVVQWTTGNVGKRSVRAVVAHPDLELVGCYAWSADKVGRDVGELCGIDPVGVTATNDVDALLALQPDCVVYNPMWPDTDELVRILEAGVNVVSTAAFINGRGLGADRDRIVDACERGGSSMFGTGISPGFVELHRHRRRRHLRPDRQDHDRRGRPTPRSTTPPTPSCPCGFGRPIDDPELPGMAAAGHRGVRRGRGHGRRRPRRRARRDRLRGRVRPDHRGRRDGVVDDPGRAASPASPPAGRAGSATARSSSSTCGGRRARPSIPTGTIEEGHVIQVDGPPDGRGQARVPPAARLRGDDLRRLHGARA